MKIGKTYIIGAKTVGDNPFCKEKIFNEIIVLRIF